MCLDADTGKVLWEHKFNIFQSDVPPHRVGWASPAADPETGNIYALSVGASVVALSKDGKLLWQRSIGEEFAAFTTHGGRTMSPLVDGDLVIVSAAVSNWGRDANRAHRFIALDKRTGDIRLCCEPWRSPYDTAYAAPSIATINGLRLLIAGIGDGAIHAIKPQTGEKVWSFVAAKRAINTGVVVSGTRVIVSHGDENLDSNELGMIAAIDGSQTGEIKTTKWAVKGSEFGFSSPLIDGTRVYQIDSGSTLQGFRPRNRTPAVGAAARNGSRRRRPCWPTARCTSAPRTASSSSCGRTPDGVEILSEVELPISTNSCGGPRARRNRSWRRRRFRAAACSSSRATRSTRSGRRTANAGDGLRRRRAGGEGRGRARLPAGHARPNWC